MQGTVAYDISPIRGPLANAFVILINALFFNVKLVGLYDVYPRDSSQQLLNEDELMFDFIIVGGGAAGCAVANRLTEQEMWTVLLIEAGDYPPSSSEVPGLYLTFLGSNEDWQFKLEKDAKACQAMLDQRCVVNRGKVLGGTSTINNMRYVRGMMDDYDKLNTPVLTSNITYGIFKELEGFEDTGNQDELQYTYGTKGPIHLDNITYESKVKEMLKNSYRTTGYSRVPRRKYIGFTEHLMYIKKGERFNMAKAFLSPIKERPNLFLTKNTEVLGVVIKEPTDIRVNGVNVTIDGIKFFIRARKEVILAAGPINNAKLLLVSGIGPRSYLEERDIPMVSNVPAVGKNLQFHLSVPVYVSIEPCCNEIEDHYRDFELIGDVFDYLMYRAGNLSHTGLNHLTNYISTRKIGTTLPNIGIQHTYFKIGDRNLMAWLDAMEYHASIKNSLLTINGEKAIIMFSVTLLSPLSRGEVSLNETHFYSNPMIKPNFLSDLDNMDYETLLSGFNYVTNLTDVEDMVMHKATYLDLTIPNCRNFKFCTASYVKCYILNMAHPLSDVAGTTKIGDECDSTSVVSKDLEVKHVRCLRVADSSVLGQIPLDSTVPTDAMIGFNLAEILKKKWLKDYQSQFLTEDDEDENEDEKEKNKD